MIEIMIIVFMFAALISFYLSMRSADKNLETFYREKCLEYERCQLDLEPLEKWIKRLEEENLK